MLWHYGFSLHWFYVLIWKWSCKCVGFIALYLIFLVFNIYQYKEVNFCYQQGRSEVVDLDGDSSLSVDISDALSEKDKVKFTVHTKVSCNTSELLNCTSENLKAKGMNWLLLLFIRQRCPSSISTSFQSFVSTKNSSGYMTFLKITKIMLE